MKNGGWHAPNRERASRVAYPLRFFAKGGVLFSLGTGKQSPHVIRDKACGCPTLGFLRVGFGVLERGGSRRSNGTDR